MFNFVVFFFALEIRPKFHILTPLLILLLSYPLKVSRFGEAAVCVREEIIIRGSLKVS